MGSTIPFKKAILFIFFLLFLIILFLVKSKIDEVAVNNFEECTKDGNPVMESYPRQCRTKDGVNFVENIGNTLEKSNLIRLESPKPNDLIKSPLIVKGEARGILVF